MPALARALLSTSCGLSFSLVPYRAPSLRPRAAWPRHRSYACAGRGTPAATAGAEDRERPLSVNPPDALTDEYLAYRLSTSSTTGPNVQTQRATYRKSNETHRNRLGTRGQAPPLHSFDSSPAQRSLATKHTPQSSSLKSRATLSATPRQVVRAPTTICRTRRRVEPTSPRLNLRTVEGVVNAQPCASPSAYCCSHPEATRACCECTAPCALVNAHPCAPSPRRTAVHLRGRSSPL